jgi:hypothetical protein
LSSTVSEGTLKSAAWSTNTTWSHDLDDLLGTHSFKVTANSVRRAAWLTATVLATATDAGRSGKITSESAKTAEEMLGGQRADDGPDGRDSMCLRLGIDPNLVTVPPRELILEEQFLPMEHTPAGEAAAREITRELATRTMLEVRDEDGYTVAEAVTAGGAARERAAAIIDDCEWRISRAEPGTAGAMPLPEDLRRRAGLPLKLR